MTLYVKGRQMIRPGTAPNRFFAVAACALLGSTSVAQAAPFLADRIEQAKSESTCRAIAAEAPTAEGTRLLVARCREISDERTKRERENARRLAEIKSDPATLAQWSQRCSDFERQAKKKEAAAKLNDDMVWYLSNRPRECWLLEEDGKQ